MWIAFNSEIGPGFISVVKDPKAKDPHRLVVRARDRHSLLAFRLTCPGRMRILCERDRDYRYRAKVDRLNFSQWLHEQADGLTYTNFKVQAERTDKRKVSQRECFGDFLFDIWLVGRNYQEGRLTYPD